MQKTLALVVAEYSRPSFPMDGLYMDGQTVSPSPVLNSQIRVPSGLIASTLQQEVPAYRVPSLPMLGVWMVQLLS